MPGKRITVNAERLSLFRTENQYTDTALGEALGLHGTSIGTYIRSNKMPKTVELALETLERRQGHRNDTSLVLVRIPATQLETLNKIVITFGGSGFVIPKELLN